MPPSISRAPYQNLPVPYGHKMAAPQSIRYNPYLRMPQVTPQMIPPQSTKMGQQVVQPKLPSMMILQHSTLMPPQPPNNIPQRKTNSLN